MRKKAFPILIGELRIFGKFAFDHQLFDVIYRVNVGHAISDNAANGLEATVRSHGCNSVALDEYITVGQKLESFQSRAIRSKDALSTFDKTLLIPDQSANLDYIASSCVLENFDGLRGRDTAREQLYKIPSFEDSSRVVGFAGGSDGHRSFDQVERAKYA